MKALYDHDWVMGVLPHRDPMLLVDEVLSLRPMESIETSFYVRPEWDIFCGHFPEAPVLPGVLSVECLAQASDILIMTTLEYCGKTPLLAGIDQVRFQRKIIPGDIVYAKAKLLENNTEKAIVSCSTELILHDEVAVKAIIRIAMR